MNSPLVSSKIMDVLKLAQLSKVPNNVWCSDQDPNTVCLLPVTVMAPGSPFPLKTPFCASDSQRSQASPASSPTAWPARPSGLCTAVPELR